MTIPIDSPVTRALIATPQTIAQEQAALRRKIKTLVPSVESCLERIGDLAVYNPTQEQRDYILNHLDAAITHIKNKFDTVAPRQTFLIPE
jgi:hypothetical protein